MYNFNLDLVLECSVLENDMMKFSYRQTEPNQTSLQVCRLLLLVATTIINCGCAVEVAALPSASRVQCEWSLVMRYNDEASLDEEAVM